MSTANERTARGVFDCSAVVHPASQRLWWHQLISVGRKQRAIEAGFAVTFYRTRDGRHVVLDSQETEDSPFYAG